MLQEQAPNSYRNFSGEEKTKKRNMEEIDAKVFLKKINKNLKNMEKGVVTQEKWH